MKDKIRSAAVGGTFDLFHLGHKAFLDFAFKKSDFVSIGVVSDKFAVKLGKNTFQNFSERKKQVEAFLVRRGYSTRSQIIPLDDIYGTAMVDKNLEAIIVTNETKKGAELINLRRQNDGLVPLKIMSFRIIIKDGLKISSSFIRKGIINREGINYRQFLLKRDFVLPESLRENLQKPFGKIFKEPLDIQEGQLVTTVGDQTTFDFLKHGIIPNLAIIDLRIQRLSKFQSYTDLGFKKGITIRKVTNAAGSICKELSQTISDCYGSGKQSVVVVAGEEDLATIPCVLLAPIPSCVFYGLRNVGLLQVAVDPKTKDKFFNILKRFSY